MTEQHYVYQGPQPCGCNLDTGFCADHRWKMQQIRAVVDRGDSPQFDAIWALSDGYGEPGFVPEQGYDWSAIRDSSVEAIDAMYAAAQSVPEGSHD